MQPASEPALAGLAWRTWLGRGGVGALSLALLVLGLQVLAAELHGRQAEAFLAHWSDTGGTPPAQQWQLAEGAAEGAVNLFPVDHGGHWQRLGLVREWRHARLNPGRTEADDTRRAALDAYRQATRLLPQSPYPRAGVMHTKMRVLEFDEEFRDAQRQAIALGPWRPRVTELVVQAGIIGWHSLDDEQHQWVLDAFQRSARQDHQQALALLKLAQRFHLSRPLCGVVVDMPVWPADLCGI